MSAATGIHWIHSTETVDLREKAANSRLLDERWRNCGFRKCESRGANFINHCVSPNIPGTLMLRQVDEHWSVLQIHYLSLCRSTFTL